MNHKEAVELARFEPFNQGRTTMSETAQFVVVEEELNTFDVSVRVAHGPFDSKEEADRFQEQHQRNADVFTRPYGSRLWFSTAPLRPVITSTLAAQVRRRAADELRQEELEKLVEEEKARLREKRDRPWWRKVFPFVISVRRI